MSRVSGSLVELEGLASVAMYDVVLLGERQLPGEVVAITDRRITVQAYEDTGGLAPGAPVVSRGAPLSAELGPGLLGSVFDGLLRPCPGPEPGWFRAGHRRPAPTEAGKSLPRSPKAPSWRRVMSWDRSAAALRCRCGSWFLRHRRCGGAHR